MAEQVIDEYIYGDHKLNKKLSSRQIQAAFPYIFLGKYLPDEHKFKASSLWSFLLKLIEDFFKHHLVRKLISLTKSSFDQANCRREAKKRAYKTEIFGLTNRNRNQPNY